MRLSDDETYTRRKECLAIKYNGIFSGKAQAKQRCLFLANLLEGGGNPLANYYEVECPEILKDRY